MAAGSPWIVGLCSVVFDVDYGQKIDHAVPRDCLSDQEKIDVGFNSFPDSLSMELQSRSSIRDSSFFFRIKRKSPGSQDLDRFLYGFVFCRQRYDESLRRGGEQMSVVVLSHFPFTSILRPLSQIAGPLFFNEGPAALERVFRAVLSWPSPRIGPLLQLPVDTISITARVPSLTTLPYPHLESKDTAQLQTLSRQASRGTEATLARRSSSQSLSTDGSEVLSPPPSISLDSSATPPSKAAQALSPAVALPPLPLTMITPPRSSSPPLSARGSLSQRTRSSSALRQSASGGEVDFGQPVFSEVDVYTPLQGVLNSLWTLWEMTLLGYPMIVAAPSPGEASSAVAALLSMISPLPYPGDFRPYYTIHDSSFKVLCSAGKPPEGDGTLPTLLGITNLFFMKALSQWTNVLSVGTKAAGRPGTAGGSVGPGRPGGSSGSKKPQGPQQLLSDHMEKLWTSYKPLTRIDKTLLSRLAQVQSSDPKARSRVATINSDALRKHFTSLTSTFLEPFQPYLTPGTSGKVPPWHAPTFLAAIKASKAQSPLLERLNNSNGNVMELYKRFLASPTFRMWFRYHQQQVAHLIDSTEGPPGSNGCLSAPSASPGFTKAMKHMDEVQLVQAFSSLEAQLLTAMEATQETEDGAGDTGAPSWGAVKRLKLELSAVFGAMPEDLQATMASSPARQRLLRLLQSADPHHAAMFASLLARLQ